jgi:serine/threonine-protein kinase
MADASRTSSLRPPPVGPTAPSTALVVGDVIAEGGMGVVRAAVQRSLGRSVVIKTALPHASEGDAHRMLLEAWVTGYLEHPGIVPVYDIVQGEDGSPIVVMRRIRGRTWHSCIRDASWAEAEGARDLLEQNLRVFIRVCEILEFAHSKHVVHRDVKPSNVMVGSFGEVYLLDWGLAVATGGDAAEHLPRAKVVEDVCGTFSYAAPEMVGLLEVPVSERTDVYLLGSVLFELATGSPPHRAGDARLTLESIAATPPAIPAGVSRQLAEILRRALQRYPEDRHASVGDLRREVLAFLRQRDSEHIALEAEKTLADLERACAEGKERQRIHDLYGVCRFAFREALRTWPENAPAHTGLARAVRAIVEHELAREPAVARALLAHAPAPLPDLEARVNAAIAAEEERRDALSKVARDHDANIGRRGW